MTAEEQLEIRLEEWGEHSWIKALLNTLTGTYGSAQFRFVATTQVATTEGNHHDPSDHRALGATFPLVRWQSLDSPDEPDPWSETMRERLHELDRELIHDGWVRRDDADEHWWSYRYTRPIH